MLVYKSICPVLSEYKSWYKIRKFLKNFGLTRGEQNKVIDFCDCKPTINQ